MALTNIYNFSRDRGDTLVHEIQVSTSAGAPLDLTTAEVVYRLATVTSDRTLVLLKSVSQGGVVLVDPVAGVLQVQIPAEEMAALTKQQYYYECEVTVADHTHTVQRGTLTLLGSIPPAR
jgi:hypothetical protein